MQIKKINHKFLSNLINYINLSKITYYKNVYNYV